MRKALSLMLLSVLLYSCMGNSDPAGDNIPDTFTVSFNSDGGSTVSSQTVSTGSLVTAPTSPTRTGAVFVGWYSDEALTDSWDFSIDTVSKDLTLYALWTSETFTVSFDSNVGSAVASLKVETGNLITAPASPTLAGFVFAGWYIDASCTDLWDFSSDTVSRDLTLYALWYLENSVSAIISIPVAGEVSFTPASISVVKGTAFNLSIEQTVYTAFDWYLDGDLISGEVSSSVTIDTSGLFAGVHELMLVVNNSNGDQASGTCRFTVTN